MADKEISDFTAASVLAGSAEVDGTEVAHVKQGGNSRKVTMAGILRRVRKTLGSAHSNSTVTMTTVTDGTTAWTITVKNGRTYRIWALGTYQTAATTTGCIFGLRNVVTATGTVLGYVRGAIVNTAAATGLSIPLVSLTGSLTTTSVSATNTPHNIEMEFIFVCTADGTFDVGFASEVGSSAAQLNAGSTLIVEDIT